MQAACPPTGLLRGHQWPWKPFRGVRYSAPSQRPRSTRPAEQATSISQGEIHLSHRIQAAIVALILVLAAGLAGCGGDSGTSEDPDQILDETFNNPDQIDSGVLDLTLSGSAGDQGSLSAELSGPFQGVSDVSQIPQLEWTGSLDAEGPDGSLSFEGGLTITGDNAYVTYQGQAYEVGERVFEQLQSRYSEANAQQEDDVQSFTQACEQAVEQGGGDASVCDIDPSTWLTNVTDEGSESVGGTDTIHISGDADVERILADVSKVAAELPGASARGFSADQLDQVEPAVKSATIDVYSGEDDKILRKLDFSLTLDPSALGSGAVPISSVDVSFSVAFSDVNSSQTITAPENPQPISKLGIGALGPLGSLDGGGGGPGEAYLECIQENPSDTDKCASELQ